MRVVVLMAQLSIPESLLVQIASSDSMVVLDVVVRTKEVQWWATETKAPLSAFLLE